ncbi:hypothetical protein GW17_00032432 [Ensete ventricosum]|nr:hypothetical protein GW17_00032432 [Ensete ventricosum]RZR84368.1 hypothetical protein BHM03_00011196 [Ensete ventricosum]
MEKCVDVYLHYGGSWVMSPRLQYAGGDEHIVEDFDCDYLSITSIKNVYRDQLKCYNVNDVYMLETGLDLHEGLFLVDDGSGIRKIMQEIDSDTNFLEIYASHGVDEPRYAPNILTIEANDTEPVVAGNEGITEANEPEPVVDEDERITEANLFIDDEVDRLVTEWINTQGSRTDLNSEGEGDGGCDINETDSDTSTSSEDEEEIYNAVDQNDSSDESDKDCLEDVERRNRTKFNVYDDTPILSLGIPFTNATEVRDSVAKYAISIVVSLNDYKIKGMKADAEAELRANVSFSNCKRARRAVLDEFSEVRGIANSNDSVLIQGLVHGRRSVRGYPKRKVAPVGQISRRDKS